MVSEDAVTEKACAACGVYRCTRPHDAEARLAAALVAYADALEREEEGDDYVPGGKTVSVALIGPQDRLAAAILAADPTLAADLDRGAARRLEDTEVARSILLWAVETHEADGTTRDAVGLVRHWLDTIEEATRE